MVCGRLCVQYAISNMSCMSTGSGEGGLLGGMDMRMSARESRARCVYRRCGKINYMEDDEEAYSIHPRCTCIYVQRFNSPGCVV